MAVSNSFWGSPRYDMRDVSAMVSPADVHHLAQNLDRLLGQARKAAALGQNPVNQVANKLAVGVLEETVSKVIGVVTPVADVTSVKQSNVEPADEESTNSFKM
ncbi:MAG: hypothetical protein P4L65_01205 [Legionella sp.]|nr:hypothetical protein [Legionella sp.]